MQTQPSPSKTTHTATLSHDKPQQSESPMGTITSEQFLRAIGRQIVRALEYGDTEIAVNLLQNLELQSDEFSPAYLRQLRTALQTGDWNPLGAAFVNHDFMGRRGYILWVAPFTRLYAGEAMTRVTVLFGKVVDIELPIPNLMRLMQATCGPVHQPLTAILPITSLASCGNIGQQEAFLSPEGWCLPGSQLGPAFLNLTSHQSRCTVWVKERIQTIFAPETAVLILALIQNQTLQFQEYYLHEAGHTAGLGLQLKLAYNLMPNSYHKGWEEYKTDIVGFYLADQALSSTQAGQLAAATLLIRFGIDAHRSGGAEADHDALATLLLLERMLGSGYLQVREKGQLALTEATYIGLHRATAPHRREALALLQQEHNCVDRPQQVMDLYSQKPYPSAKACAVFKHLVQACAQKH